MGLKENGLRQKGENIMDQQPTSWTIQRLT